MTTRSNSDGRHPISLTLGPTGTGPRHTAQDPDGYRATRDSDAQSVPTRHAPTARSPGPTSAPRHAPHCRWRVPPAGDGRGTGPGADAGMRTLGPGYPARLGLGPRPNPARAHHAATGPAGQTDPAGPDPRIQPATACTRLRCVTRTGPGPEADGVARAACLARPDKHPAASCTRAEHAACRGRPRARAQPARGRAHGSHGADGHEPGRHGQRARGVSRRGRCRFRYR
jgi:hypothetical protein